MFSMATMDDILDSFFGSKIDVLNEDYDSIIDDPEDLIRVILKLTDRMEESQSFSDIKLLEQFYLTDLPKNYIIFPDEVLAIHSVLLDFYQFLYENHYLSTEVYKDLLSFFQENKHTFLKRMGDEQFWTDEKKKQMDKMDQELLDSMPPEMDNLFQDLNNILQESSDYKPKDNIIAFPTDKTKELEGSMDYAVQLRVDLKGFKPPIWRRVLVPFKYTLADLHEIIQNCFEWESEHLYLFTADGFLFEPAEMNIDDFWDEDNASYNPSEVTVGEIFTRFNTVDYIYDFGDDWQHTIKCEDILPVNKLEQNFKKVDTSHLPVCVTGRQDAPLEDSRGEGEFAPFDLDKINAKLAKL